MRKSKYTEEQIAYTLRQAESGVPVAEIMGNTPEMARKHYLRFDPKYLRAAMRALDRSATVAGGVAVEKAGHLGVGSNRSEIVVR